MDNEINNLPENAQDAPQVDQPDHLEKEEITEEKKPSQVTSGRNYILWFLGGIYLIYTGYKLCAGYINGAEGSSLFFFFSGVLFLAAGGFLAWIGGKDILRDSWQGRLTRLPEDKSVQEMENESVDTGAEKSQSESPEDEHEEEA